MNYEKYVASHDTCELHKECPHPDKFILDVIKSKDDT